MLNRKNKTFIAEIIKKKKRKKKLKKEKTKRVYSSFLIWEKMCF